jgi:hypothetical protein
MKIRELNDVIVIWGVVSSAGISYLKEQTRNTATIVVVPENRPFLIGVHHTIPLLKQEKIPFTYCTDNMVGFLFSQGKTREVLLFCQDMDEQTARGPCGSVFVTYLARLHQVPVKLLREGESTAHFLDRDASTLAGKKVVLPGQEHCIELAHDEFIERDCGITVLGEIPQSTREEYHEL